MADPMLEVIVCSLSDALAAERGGAHRLEVISHFELGGLTPAISLVRQIAERVSIPLRVMIRCSADFATPQGPAREELLDQAQHIAELGVDGFVIGFLNKGMVDDQALAEYLACSPRLKATFHRAIEDVSSVTDAICALKGHSQIDRILHSGGSDDGIHRARRLEVLARLAGPEIRVIAGGGLDERSIQAIRSRTNINEFHVGRAARTPAEMDGAVDEEKVRQLVRLIGT